MPAKKSANEEQKKTSKNKLGEKIQEVHEVSPKVQTAEGWKRAKLKETKSK